MRLSARGSGKSRRTKQTTGVNLQGSYFSRSSSKQISRHTRGAKSHLSEGKASKALNTAIRLLCRAGGARACGVAANSNNGDPIKGAVETSGKMEEQASRSPPKGSSLRDKPVQDPEWLWAVGQAKEAREGSLSWGSRWGRGDRQLQQRPGEPHTPLRSFRCPTGVLKSGGDEACSIPVSTPYLPSSQQFNYPMQQVRRCSQL